ncbi:MAG: hypothetical protein LUQ33_03595 [Methanoregulaceae archaeon]|nr:hypothetical protein [Methanoregulaceae archaeon]
MPGLPAYSNPLVNIVKKFIPILTVPAVMIIACLPDHPRICRTRWECRLFWR